VDRVTAASQSGACAGSWTTGYCIDKNTPNLLPNQSIVNSAPIDSTNLILTAGSSNSSGIIASNDVMDLFTLTKTISKLTVTTGVYFSESHFSRDFAYGGRGVMPLENNPDPLDVTFTTATSTAAGGPAGTTYQLTDPTGFGALGSSVGLTLQDRATTREISPLFGATWELTDKWLLDAGVRYTFYRGWGENRRYSTNPEAASRSFGGIDGNPLTLYDNVYAVDTANTHFVYDKSIAYMQYSGAISYFANKHLAAFLRYTSGRKNPDGFWDGFNVSQTLVNEFSLKPLAQIKQLELSTQLVYPRFTFNPVLYYVDLSQIPVRRNDGLLADGVTRYTTQPFFSHYRSYGLELDNSVRPFSWFDIRNVLTWNKGQSLAFASISLGTCNGVPTATNCPNGEKPGDTVSATYLKGPQERAAAITYNGTANFNFGRFSGYYRFRYISSRPITVADTFRLPPQSLSDIGLRYDINPAMAVHFNINNLFDDRNPTQLGQIGNLPSNMTPQQFLSQYPNALSSVVTNPPRSYFLTFSTTF
jgi:outer membrane receptor protein involved in Fe transport